MTEKKTEITSKDTSINKDKVPAIFGELAKRGVYGTHLFDIGCGKWTAHISRYAKDKGICTYYHGFDKYNRSKKQNEKVSEIAFDEKFNKKGNPNVFISSNVLNVIKGDDRKRTYLQSIFRMMKDVDECYITVYEGNRSGCGKITKKDCWQENKKLIDYFEIVKDAYRDTHLFSFMCEMPRHCIDIKYGMIRIYPAYK